MDISSVFQVLLAADEQAKQTSPYAPLNQASRGISDVILQQSAKPGASVEDALIGGLLSGLVTGGTDYLTRGYQEEQSGLARDVLAEAISGRAMQRPDRMNQSIFNTVRSTGDMYRLNQDMTRRAERDAAQDEINKVIQSERIKGIYNNPYRAGKAEEVLNEIFNGQTAGAELQSPTAPAAPIAEQLSGNLRSSFVNLPTDDGGVSAIAEPTSSATAIPPSNNIRSFESYLEQTAGDEALARTLFEKDLNKPNEQFDDIDAIRKEFSSLPEVKDFKLISTGYSALLEAMKDPEGTSDFELIRRAAQAVEPGLAVRKDDQDSIERAPSFFKGFEAAVRGALYGETRLTPEVRQGLLRIAERSYNANAKKFNKTREFYTQQLEKRKLDPTALTPMPIAELVESSLNKAIPDKEAAIAELRRRGKL